jgi:mannose-6-phosphate isomerase-like protein (cupin superfamily)
MNQVVEHLDRFDSSAPVRVLARNETLMYTKALAGPFGEVASATELVEVVHLPPHYVAGEFGPPKVLFEAPRARIEWQQMDNRQPHFHRNLDVDEMSYQISGERTLMSEHGTVELRTGDFVRLPVGVCHDNWGRKESHILWYTPEGAVEDLPADRLGQVLIPPFEGWEASIVNEALTDCLGAPEHVIVGQRADERLILEDALTHEERLAVIYVRHGDADEIQYQVTGRRLLATHHGVVSVEPGDFVRIPVGVAFTTISDEPGKYIATLSANRMVRSHPATRVGEPWDMGEIADARSRARESQSVSAGAAEMV